MATVGVKGLKLLTTMCFGNVGC